MTLNLRAARTDPLIGIAANRINIVISTRLCTATTSKSHRVWWWYLKAFCSTELHRQAKDMSLMHALWAYDYVWYNWIKARHVTLLNNGRSARLYVQHATSCAVIPKRVGDTIERASIQCMSFDPSIWLSDHNIIKGKGKGRVTCYSASYTSTWPEALYNIGSGSCLAWANDIYRIALCGHPLPASANNWTRGLQLADIPPPQSATLGLHPVARKLLLISRPAEGRRLSWPEHTVG